ncbi:SOS-induced cell division inhibitor SulA [Erwinia sp. 9145]|uniref:SOS-induced cell division inhibitor SulA n=1 Tax=Erwinia sp. 9145 TaxID=1500895 RepID=UPI0005587BE0|nr:SOS-induced cell division inhibitor SulA [Erwinia sp. 9145]
MQTHSLKKHRVNRRYSETSASAISDFSAAPGLISELVYSENQPGLTQLLLLPLLQQLGTQSRWQLWLTPPHKLSRNWLRDAGLPLNKVMQVPPTQTITTVEAMIKALQTGNYSVVLGWISEEISVSERCRLQQAARSGQALGLIMCPDRANCAPSRPLNGLKIHSTLYH